MNGDSEIQGSEKEYNLYFLLQDNWQVKNEIDAGYYNSMLHNHPKADEETKLAWKNRFCKKPSGYGPINFKYKIPEAVTKVSVKANGIPEALKKGWKFITSLQTCIIGSVLFIGMELPDEAPEFAVARMNQYYNACLSQLLSVHRRRNRREQYVYLSSADKEEALEKEKTNIVYTNGVIKVLESVLKKEYGVDYSYADIFAIAYIKDVLEDMRSKNNDMALWMENWIESDELEKIKTFVYEGVLDSGTHIYEYIPVSIWELNVDYYLSDYNGVILNEDMINKVEHEITSVAEQKESLKNLCSRYNDMRPYALHINLLAEKGLFGEIDYIINFLRDCGSPFTQYFSSENFEAFKKWKKENAQ